MRQTTVNRTIAGQTITHRMRQPHYIAHLFPEMTFFNTIVFRSPADLELIQEAAGDSSISALGLKTDVTGIHVLLEYDDYVTLSTLDFDEIDADLRDAHVIPGVLTGSYFLDYLAANGGGWISDEAMGNIDSLNDDEVVEVTL